MKRKQPSPWERGNHEVVGVVSIVAKRFIAYSVTVRCFALLSMTNGVELSALFVVPNKRSADDLTDVERVR